MTLMMMFPLKIICLKMIGVHN